MTLASVEVVTPAWVADAVFYQIFPDRFASSPRVAKPGRMEPWDAAPTRHGLKGGDLLGIVEGLDYLQDLGVTALYLNPVFTSAANHRYHTYDYLAVDPLLGGTPALRELVDACHARSIRVILDGVFNHTGRGFWPFHHVLENGGRSPYRDWFYFDQAALDAGHPVHAYPPVDNEGRLVAEHAADPAHRAGELSLAALGYRAWWDLPALPKLNVANPAVREYLLRVAEHWIAFGADGWRIDVPDEIDDDAFWREFRRRVKAINPDAYLVAEVWSGRTDRLAGDQFDAAMNYPLAEGILGFAAAPHLDFQVIREQYDYAQRVRALDAATFAAAVERSLVAADPAIVRSHLNLIGSHDLPRFLSMAGGDRTSLMLATLLQMTLPGAPCVYYGDEIGMLGRADPDCRRAFPWDQSRWDLELRAFVRSAIAVRHANPVLRSLGYRTLFGEGQTLAYLRNDAGAAILVAINAGDVPCPLAIRAPELQGRSVAPLLSTSSGVQVPGTDSDGGFAITVPPRAGVALSTMS
ncbi:MAG: glycoside hydrolase family 13 protein [Candidatus Limnocylindria bacterium]